MKYYNAIKALLQSDELDTRGITAKEEMDPIVTELEAEAEEAEATTVTEPEAEATTVTELEAEATVAGLKRKAGFEPTHMEKLKLYDTIGAGQVGKSDRVCTQLYRQTDKGAKANILSID